MSSSLVVGKRKANPEWGIDLTQDHSCELALGLTSSVISNGIHRKKRAYSDNNSHHNNLESTNLLLLPEDIQRTIYRYLDLDSLLTLRSISKNLLHFLDSSLLFLVPRLERSSSDNTPELNEIAFRDMINNFPLMNGLSLRACFVSKIIPQLPSGLLYLDLASAKDLTNELLTHLPRGLLHLNLNNCTSISSNGLQNLPPGLLTLMIGNCVLVNDESMAILPSSLLNLSIYGCSKVTDIGLRSLSMLKKLNSEWCVNITTNYMDMMME